MDYLLTLLYLLSRAGADEVNGGEVNGNWSLPFMKKASMGLIWFQRDGNWSWQFMTKVSMVRNFLSANIMTKVLVV